MIDTLQQPTLRRIYVIAWVALVTVTLLQSSGSPVVGPPAPPGPPSASRELLLTTGHVVAFTGLMALLWWALRPARHALAAALITCLIYGLLTELAQTLVPDRSASFSDLAVNSLTSLLIAVLIYWRTHEATV